MHTQCTAQWCTVADSGRQGRQDRRNRREGSPVCAECLEEIIFFLLHETQQMLLLTPQLLQRYCLEHPQSQHIVTDRQTSRYTDRCTGTPTHRWLLLLLLLSCLSCHDRRLVLAVIRILPSLQPPAQRYGGTAVRRYNGRVIQLCSMVMQQRYSVVMQQRYGMVMQQRYGMVMQQRYSMVMQQRSIAVHSHSGTSCGMSTTPSAQTVSTYSQ